MEWNYIWMVVMLPAILLFLVVTYQMIRKGYAKRKVAGRSVEEKVAALNKDFEPFGFLYDEAQDIIISAMYPWQRELGYCRLYDEAALTMNMAIQSEPIYFLYDNRRWLIEFWKGQYGMTTGAEVGIYVTDKEDISVPGMFEGPFFHAVSDEERIPMEFLLYRDYKLLLSRNGTHWWLTSFAVGLFTKLKNLSMDIRLTFPNRAMLMAFVKGLREAGYREGAYLVHRNIVQIHFTVPKSKQPYRKWRPVYFLVQCLNRCYCMLFRKITGDFIKTLDKIDYLRFRFPLLYHMVVGIGRPLKMQKVYQRLQKHADNVQEVER